MISNRLRRNLRALPLVAGEWLATRSAERRPEPEAMGAAASVAAFDAAGAVGGALEPVYEFNTLAVSRMLPAGARLFDLGSGSGRFLIHLARRRPDLAITGVELSGAMAEQARHAVCEAGLAGRITMVEGDMTRLDSLAGGRVDAVSAVFSLHHLPGVGDLRRCLAGIALLRRRWGCGAWIFDHARPRRVHTARRFPEVFTPSEPEAFRRDSANSLAAAFSFDELSAALREAGLGCCRGELSRVLAVYQAHWAEPEGLLRPEPADLPARIVRHELAPGSVETLAELRSLLRGVPLLS